LHTTQIVKAPSDLQEPLVNLQLLLRCDNAESSRFGGPIAPERGPAAKLVSVPGDCRAAGISMGWKAGSAPRPLQGERHRLGLWATVGGPSSRRHGVGARHRRVLAPPHEWHLPARRGMICLLRQLELTLA
jgi:hypothetical protein